jgi:hypothetical protein
MGHDFKQEELAKAIGVKDYTVREGSLNGTSLGD